MRCGRYGREDVCLACTHKSGAMARRKKTIIVAALLISPQGQGQSKANPASENGNTRTPFVDSTKDDKLSEGMADFLFCFPRSHIPKCDFNGCNFNGNAVSVGPPFFNLRLLLTRHPRPFNKRVPSSH